VGSTRQQYKEGEGELGQPMDNGPKLVIAPGPSKGLS
jgi:hypothetical protein